jgi:hypothetical protein
MTPLHDTVTDGPHRADYGAVRLGRRDTDGLILCAEQYGAPYDLLAGWTCPRARGRPGSPVARSPRR